MMAEEEAKERIEIVNADVEEQQVAEESCRRTPPWSEHITVRGVVASFVIGVMYSMIAMKILLTTGPVPSFNVSAALLSFVFLRTWTQILQKVGIVSTPFTQQENTVVQTCAVACYSICLGGGFGTYLVALSKKTYEEAGVDTEGNTPGSYKDPGIGWMTSYVFVASFVGLWALVPLRKIMIIDYKLTFPSGTAVAVLINGFHNPKGDQMAQKQVDGFAKFFTISFIWGFFQWFYSGGDGCGFSQFPIFGLQAWKQTYYVNLKPIKFWILLLSLILLLIQVPGFCRFYLSFSMTYIGAGMICSHLVNLSLLLGAVISWGIMWPLLRGFKGDWYPESLPESSMKSLQGYKVFISIALMLGHGLYNFLKILAFTTRSICSKLNHKSLTIGSDHQDQAINDIQQNETFMRERIPIWVAFCGYALLSIISIITIPLMFQEMRWYYVLIAYIFAPFLGFCNAYGAGLTDMNMAYNYGKVSLFILASWAGKDSGVVAGLVGCGLIAMIVSTSAELMQDFKSGHLTLTSPRSMLLSQAIGTAMGCVVAPLTFSLFNKAFDVGGPDGELKAPFAIIYRNMAILGVEGFSALPRHCLQLCYCSFAFAVGVNLVRDLSPPKFAKWVPLPMAMSVFFLVGAHYAVDMCVGSLIVFALHKLNHRKASLMIPAIASGLICGDGLWILPSSILALAKISPPICMRFRPT